MKYLFLLFTSILFAGCHNFMAPQAPDASKPSIVFGNGGGFTGAVNSYTLQENGYLFSGDGELTSYKHIGRIDENKAKQYFVIMRSLIEQFPSIQKPGNIYRFVGLMDRSGYYKYSWQDKNQIPKEINLLYEILSKTVEK